MYYFATYNHRHLREAELEQLLQSWIEILTESEFESEVKKVKELLDKLLQKSTSDSEPDDTYFNFISL